MPTTTISTTLLESVNIVLANLGESPVNTLSGGALPHQVSLALNTIEEVSTDIQSKGWWFNQQTAGDFDTTANVVIYPSNSAFSWSANIPEEARRYITVRSARVCQSRLIGSEELQKFSYSEELVSLAIFQQAHVRNSNGVLDFNDFPEELRGLGIDEVMFLQGNYEEKIHTLRLGTELAAIDKTKAETALTGKQGSLLDQQVLTETENTLKTYAEAGLTIRQQGLIDQQTEDVGADTALKTSQKTQLDAATAIEAVAEKAFYDGVVAGTQDTYRDYAAEMRIMGVQEVIFQQTPAYKKIELIKDATKLRTSTATETGTDAKELSEVNKIMRLIGEPPVTALNSHSLASECVRFLRDTNTELQGRGWWFNIEKDVEFTPDSQGRVQIPSDVLYVEVDGYATRMKNVGGTFYLYDFKEKSHEAWSGTVKARLIYERTLDDVPQKFLEYLEVRVAILLTELYPQSGVDIQRLPKMEAELRAYFKDRDNDEANYSMFDNYDTVSILGVNRPITLI